MENLEDFEKQTFEHTELPDKSTKKDALLPQRPIWLPNPCGIIKELNIKKILETFQNVAYIGVLKQRWEEIKKLNSQPHLALST